MSGPFLKDFHFDIVFHSCRQIKQDSWWYVKEKLNAKLQSVKASQTEVHRKWGRSMRWLHLLRKRLLIKFGQNPKCATVSTWNIGSKPLIKQPAYSQLKLVSKSFYCKRHQYDRFKRVCLWRRGEQHTVITYCSACVSVIDFCCVCVFFPLSHNDINSLITSLTLQSNCSLTSNKLWK